MRNLLKLNSISEIGNSVVKYDRIIYEQSTDLIHIKQK